VKYGFERACESTLVSSSDRDDRDALVLGAEKETNLDPKWEMMKETHSEHVLEVRIKSTLQHALGR
jgi:hypothetical protein